jgi:hypothetical protein
MSVPDVHGEARVECVYERGRRNAVLHRKRNAGLEQTPLSAQLITLTALAAGWRCAPSTPGSRRVNAGRTRVVQPRDTA